jgi:hypothetical protein
MKGLRMKKSLSHEKKRGGMKRLSSLTEPVIATATNNQGALYTQICSLWPDIAGEMAVWSYPKNLTFAKSTRHNGNLAIWVIAGRGPEAQARSQELVNAINRVCGFKAVSRLTCQQTFELSDKMGSLKNKKTAATSHSMQTEPDPMVLNLLEQQTNDISSPELRATLIKLGRTIAAKK